jgi:DNA polymerase III sliding clamp (beta) subunit (PCNA family)
MNKKLDTKLTKLKETWSRYQSSKEVLDTLKMETGILNDLYNTQAEKIASEMRKRSLNEIKTDDGTFKLKRIVNTKIINRTEADEYDQEFKLGLFQKSICGPRVKAWTLQQLEKGLKVPDFVDVVEVWTINIE